ncbi:MAG: hypothetical protein K2I00_02220 [Ruminococcus sp.]|nr:hypothetical protein [Ruminococcus sp.]
MKDKIAKLIDVKSLVTLILTAVFAIQTTRGIITSEQFQTIFTTVIAFYFGIQYAKNSTEEKI